MIRTLLLLISCRGFWPESGHGVAGVALPCCTPPGSVSDPFRGYTGLLSSTKGSATLTYLAKILGTAMLVSRSRAKDMDMPRSVNKTSVTSEVLR